MDKESLGIATIILSFGLAIGIAFGSLFVCIAAADWISTSDSGYVPEPVSLTSWVRILPSLFIFNYLGTLLCQSQNTA